MEELTLEKEFAIFAQIHKATILQAKIATYYRELQETGVRIPEFMNVAPEKLAEKEVIQLINSPKLFDRLYEHAWSEYAEYLP